MSNIQDYARPTQLMRESSINILDLGCKMNDPSFKDNAKILTAAFQKAFARSNNLEFYFPGGALYTYDTIELPRRSGIRIKGNGPQYDRLNSNSFWSPPDSTISTFFNIGGPTSRIIYMGPVEKPCMLLMGAGTTIDGLVLQDGEAPENFKPPIRPGSIGIKVNGNDGIPTSKTYFPVLSMFNWDTAIKVTRDPEPQGENNSDTMIFGILIALECRTVYRVESWQSVDHIFHYVHTAANETVFDFEHGGGLMVNAHECMPTWGRYPGTTVLRLGEQRFNDNTCFFRFNYLKTDGGFHGLKLLKTNSLLYGRIIMDGLIAVTDLIMDPNPVDIYKDASGFCGNLALEINMAYGGLTYDGKVWPPQTTKNKWS